MKRYNWKKLNESFFDDIEDDIIGNDSLMTDNILNIIEDNRTILDSKNIDDVLDSLLKKFNIGNFVYNLIPTAVNAALKEILNGGIVDIETVYNKLSEIYKYNFNHGFNSLEICRVDEIDPTGFLTTNLKDSVYYRTINVNINIQSSYGIATLYLTSIRFIDRYVTSNIPLYAWSIASKKPHASKNREIIKNMRPMLLEAMNTVFKYTGGLNNILDEIKYRSAFDIPISDKDMDRMKKCILTLKLAGYEAINNLKKKIPRIAAWYVIKFGERNVEKLTEDMLIGWCLYKHNIIDDPNKKLMGLGKIYIKDVINSIIS